MSEKKSYNKRYTARRKLIYIHPDQENAWNEIKKAAKEENRGLGYFICKFWEKMKNRND